MEWLNSVWEYVVPIGGGITIGAIVVAILSAILKGFTTKFTEKVNLQAIEQKAVDSGIDKLKNVSFKQTIQPVVESGLKKVSEEANARIDEHLAETELRYQKLITIMEKFACYFDGAVGVSQEVKDDFKQAIKDAQIDTVDETLTAVEEVKETAKTATKAKETVVDTETVER